MTMPSSIPLETMSGQCYCEVGYDPEIRQTRDGDIPLDLRFSQRGWKVAPRSRTRLGPTGIDARQTHKMRTEARPGTLSLKTTHVGAAALGCPTERGELAS